MTEEKIIDQDLVSEYRRVISLIGRNEFILSKMLEYGFWPKGLPTPHEKQKDESEEDFQKRKKIKEQFDDIVRRIAELYTDRQNANQKLRQLKKEYAETWDIDKIRRDIAKVLWDESKAKRAERKRQRELEKQHRSEEWKKKKAEEIVFVGRGYSSLLYKLETDEEKLNTIGLPIIKSEKQLAEFLGIEYKKLRFLTYHRDAAEIDHYTRYNIPKRSGGIRSIAAPKSLLKKSQRIILDEILSKVPISESAHGFIRERSVITGAKNHPSEPKLVINMDLQDFFPTITFERVRGMFHKLGYSGKISTLLAMLSTYSERIPIEVKGKTKYVAITKRILPQGSPASPGITNIICRRLDKRLSSLAKKCGVSYSRYADDMSFSLENNSDLNIGKFCGLVSKIIKEEGFQINLKKTRYLRKNNRQEITGIVVNNSELGIPRKWIKNFRAAIYNAQKIKRNEKDLPLETKNQLSGMASWARSVNPSRYKKYIDAVTELLK